MKFNERVGGCIMLFFCYVVFCVMLCIVCECVGDEVIVVVYCYLND